MIVTEINSPRISQIVRRTPIGNSTEEQVSVVRGQCLIYENFLLHKKIRLPLLVDSSDEMSDESHMVRPARN